MMLTSSNQDDIEFIPPTPPVKDVLGGAGTFSALGARLLSPPPRSGSVGWVVDKGSDFPPDLETLIMSWGTSVLLRETPERLTTRGWNGYDEHQNRAFRYMTPKKRLTAEDLTPELLASRTFHLICSPKRCRELVLEIKDKRADLPASVYNGLSGENARDGGDDTTGNHLPKPIFIWEPVPDLCTPDELLNCTNVLPLIDVMSPNHAELAGFMGDDGLDPETGEISTRAIERACEQLLGSMPLQSFSIVVRAGEKGCYLARNGGRKRTHKHKSKPKGKKPSALLHGGLQPDTDMEALFAGLLQDAEGSIAREEIEVDPGVERWIPAFHNKSYEEGNDAPPDEREVAEGETVQKRQNKGRVIDPTGGGNTFLGGLAVALARGKGLEEAAAWASVAASFAIEQIGVPTIGQDDQGNETWNGVRVDERFEEFKTRLAFSC
ncbi:Ribokinase-like protein [Xylaria bambusicola]|uniref:Ribokinase-like protein n=1 Tax=Xylaria bambusicola TaxID=326684 RepID=UPI0020073931|nr:Ribokinase-like protein [Xylaria bambusicola]KAI0523684.1 Ribokinase-like protein [Xylaria bambusicola]